MFDLIVITAANEAQAAGYREQIAWRRTNGFFNSETETMVVTDPGRLGGRTRPARVRFQQLR